LWAVRKFSSSEEVVAREVEAPAQAKYAINTSREIDKNMGVDGDIYLGHPQALSPTSQSSHWHHESDPPALL
jgi:hypothetical protein